MLEIHKTSPKHKKTASCIPLYTNITLSPIGTQNCNQTTMYFDHPTRWRHLQSQTWRAQLLQLGKSGAPCHQGWKKTMYRLASWTVRIIFPPYKYSMHETHVDLKTILGIAKSWAQSKNR